MLEKNRHNIDFQIPPLAHTSMYNWHKYWARKTWNVVGEWIETYTPENGVVIDPFMGSGVAIIEAVRRGRRAIGIDLNPIAVEIVDLTLREIDLKKLEKAYEKIEKAVADRIEALYKTNCRKCDKEIDAACFIWNKGKPESVRYECNECGSREEQGRRLRPRDREILERAEELLGSSRMWYPRDALYYPDGSPFKEKQKYESIPDLFTVRNLYALALLMHQIEKENDELLKRFLKITFSSMTHLCSRMVPAISASDTNHQTAFSSTWTQHSYWHTPRFMEQPVWRKFKSAFEGHQGILKAKEESEGVFKEPVRFAKTIEQFANGKGDVLLVCGSALSTLRHWREKKGLVEWADFCFTDPPYASSIQYGELSFMWAKWLDFNGDYLKDLCEHEVVENPRQKKDFAYYEGMLSSTLGEISSALKPGAHMVLTFHNPTFKVRNATIRAAVRKGFDFEKIHHQPTAVVSAKSLLQPFGSATGDFYLRFIRPFLQEPTPLARWDEKRFERVVVDGVQHLLAERWEPTPYTFIINYIDPLLAREGFFQELYPGLDVSTVLKNHEGEEFVTVDVRIGGQTGKAWWFKHPERIKTKGIPLGERVEQCVLRELLSKRRVTFTDVWRRVGEEFPNSLTPDALSIRDVIREYAKEAGGGEWQIIPKFQERVKQHALMIWILGNVGRSLGYRIWIGRNEQKDITPSNEKLSSLVTIKAGEFLSGSKETMRAISDIDLIWLKKNEIVRVFEVEYSTTITSAVERCSHLPQNISRYIVLPEERTSKLKRKLESPFFKQGLQGQGWRIILFDKILDNREALLKGNLDIAALEWDYMSEPLKRDYRQLILI